MTSVGNILCSSCSMTPTVVIVFITFCNNIASQRHEAKSLLNTFQFPIHKARKPSFSKTSLNSGSIKFNLRWASFNAPCIAIFCFGLFLCSTKATNMPSHTKTRGLQKWASLSSSSTEDWKSKQQWIHMHLSSCTLWRSTSKQYYSKRRSIYQLCTLCEPM